MSYYRLLQLKAIFAFEVSDSISMPTVNSTILLLAITNTHTNTTSTFAAPYAINTSVPSFVATPTIRTIVTGCPSMLAIKDTTTDPFSTTSSILGAMALMVGIPSAILAFRKLRKHKHSAVQKHSKKRLLQLG
jgi:hypothetical protein